MTYQLSFAADPADSVRENLRAELTAARTLLADDACADPVEAIHDARKSLKKTRALLRLVRPGLGGRVYRHENRALRDAARLVSGARDADVLIETVEKLAARYVELVPAQDFEDLRSHLHAESLALRGSAVGSEGRTAAIAMLDDIAGRLDDWPLAGCDWETIAAGMERAYRDGREAYAAVDAEPTTPRLHDWRKRVKDLWYHERLTCPAWPGVLGAQAQEAHLLSEILGDDHDLAVLGELLSAPDGQGVPAAFDPRPLLGLVTKRRRELLSGARQLGSLIYAERPNAFARRTRRYLQTARLGVGDDVRV